MKLSHILGVDNARKDRRLLDEPWIELLVYLLWPHFGYNFFEFMQMFGKVLPKLVHCVTEIQNTIMYNDWAFSRLDELDDDTEIQFILDLQINHSLSMSYVGGWFNYLHIHVGSCLAFPRLKA